MLYNGLAAISDNFDVFVFDAYGVFWEGNGFYAGSREQMAELVRRGKQVIIVSNSSALGDSLYKSYTKRGLQKGRDYQYLISSGDLLRSRLQNADISFQNQPAPRRYYVLGHPHSSAFDGTVYERVATPEEADFVYVGVPYLYAADVAAYPQYQADFWPAQADAAGHITVWDTVNPAPFIEIIDRVAALALPVLNANPDFTAKEGHPLVANSPAVFVVRNGLITEMLRQRGLEVLEFGKPHRNIYDHVWQILRRDGITVDKRRTCMIGDTVRTDIKGAVNAGITPILCVETGVTAEEILRGNSVEKLCAAADIDVQQVIQIKSVGGE